MLQEEIQQYSPYTPTKLLQDSNYQYFQQNKLSPINPIKILNFDTQETLPNSSLSSLTKETSQKITHQKEKMSKIEKDMKKLNCMSEQYLSLYENKQVISNRIKQYEIQLKKQKQLLEREKKMKQDDDNWMALKFSVYFNNKIHLNHTEIKQLPEQYDLSTNKKNIPYQRYPIKSTVKPTKQQSNSIPLRSTSLHIQFSKKNNPQANKFQSKRLQQCSSETLNLNKKHSFFKRYSKQIDELQWKHNKIRQQLLGRKLKVVQNYKSTRYCYI